MVKIDTRAVIIQGSSGILLMIIWRELFYLTFLLHLESWFLVNILSSIVEDKTICHEPSRLRPNILWDFQKLRKYENWSFSRPFIYQIQLDMATKKYVTTISMDKLKKCTSQFFNFWNFVTEIFVKHIERFSKIEKIWKLVIF